MRIVEGGPLEGDRLVAVIVWMNRAHPPLLVELYQLATRRDDEIRAATDTEVLDVEDLVLV